MSPCTVLLCQAGIKAVPLESRLQKLQEGEMLQLEQLELLRLDWKVCWSCFGNDDDDDDDDEDGDDKTNFHI